MELNMSEKELDRVIVLRSVLDGSLTKVKAATTLGLSERQIRRLLVKLKSHGPQGLISPKRGKTSNRAIMTHIKEQALELVDKNYGDYGATLISEKLCERHNIKLSKETMRQWLIQSGRRDSKRIRPVKIRQLRARRDCFGELVQIDGSIHDWFEGRGEVCTLLVFKVNTPGGWNTSGLTQFGRAVKQLNIEAIFAHSPEAKGRVERANSTLQDRLVKELRYFCISTIAERARLTCIKC